MFQVAIKEETVEQEDLQGELTCEVCELTFEGILEMEQHSATHFVDDQNVRLRGLEFHASSFIARFLYPAQNLFTLTANINSNQK